LKPNAQRGGPENFKPGMTIADAFQLNEQLLRLFPTTDEERRQKAEAMANMPEFVL
jgi:hypothetical protein